MIEGVRKTVVFTKNFGVYKKGTEKTFIRSLANAIVYDSKAAKFKED